MHTDIRSAIVQAALNAQQQAYARYSQFRVGAALLVADGQIFTGCNVENASYGLTICAERAAVFAAIAAGQQQLTLLAIATRGGAMPCALAGKSWPSSRRNCRFCSSIATNLIADRSQPPRLASGCFLPSPLTPEPRTLNPLYSTSTPANSPSCG
jgi:hypothetical protein